MPLSPNELMQAKALLGKARWIKRCAPETVAGLMDVASIVRLNKGDSVSRPGEPIEHLYVVLEGSVEMSHGTARGRRFVSNFTPPGEPFGLVAMIDDKGAIHRISAHEACALILIPKADLMAAMQRDAQLLQSILRLLAQRSRGLYTSLFEASVMPLPTRLARVLLSLGAAYGVEEYDDGLALGIRVSQDDLAAMVGVTRQRLNIELKKMEREQMLRLAYTRVVVMDEQRLRLQAEESNL